MSGTGPVLYSYRSDGSLLRHMVCMMHLGLSLPLCCLEDEQASAMSGTAHDSEVLGRFLPDLVGASSAAGLVSHIPTMVRADALTDGDARLRRKATGKSMLAAAQALSCPEQQVEACIKTFLPKLPSSDSGRGGRTAPHDSPQPSRAGCCRPVAQLLKAALLGADRCRGSAPSAD